MTLKVFTHTQFQGQGHWPVGTAAVVVAENDVEAASYLERALRDNGLSQKIEPGDFSEIPLNRGSWAILCDGNY